MEKPLLLVDVDGVLNVFGPFWLDGGSEEPPAELEKVFEAQGYTIRFPTGTAERMAKLDEVFECVWATTWEGAANLQIAPELGVGQDWPVIKFYQGWGRHATWKLPDVRNWCEANAQGRRLAWVDDDLHGDADAWAVRRGEVDAPTLLMSTYFEEGLTDGHTDELLEWAHA